MDNKFLDLINRLLISGVEIYGKVHPIVKGIPQAVCSRLEQCCKNPFSGACTKGGVFIL
jgi:hypothetical protein